MAGIGFELRRAIRSKQPLRRSGGLFSAAFTCFGGMLIGIVLLTLVQLAGKANGLTQDISDLFMTYVTSTMFISMLVTSISSMALSRFVSDMLYEGKSDKVMSSALGDASFSMVFGAMVYIPFIGISSLPILDAIMLFLLFEALCLCWIMMSYIGLLRDYRQITKAFFLALMIAGAITFALGMTKIMSLRWMIAVLIIAYSIVDALLFRALYRGFPHISGSMFTFLMWIKKYPTLVVISLTTEIGLLGHFWITWYASGESVIHKGLFASCPTYDFPAIVAYFCTIPAMIYFIALFETDFYEKYHHYIDALGNGGSTATVNNARVSMISSIRRGLRNFASIQIVSCLVFITINSKLLSVLNIGMTERMLQTYQMFCVGYSLYSIGSIFMLLQMYFVNEKKAAVPSALFAIVTLVSTYIGGRINGHATGIGLCVSSFMLLTISAFQLVRCLDNLEYHILCENSTYKSENKTDHSKKTLNFALRANQRVALLSAFVVSVVMIIGPSIILIRDASRSRFIYHFSPERSDAVLLSPQMGYAPWANSDEAEEIQTTLVYVELRWADWEPSEGNYDIEYVNEEYRLDTYREQGRQVVFRFICDNPGNEDHIDIPEWLYAATDGDGYHYENDYGSGYSPNYSNEVFISAHAKAIAALGDAFGEDDFFCFVELGSLGHWGEYHVNISAGVPPLPNYDIRNEYIKPYLTAFPNARFMTRYPLVETIKYGFGLYNDMTGDPEETEYWLSQMNYGIWEQTGLPEQADTSETWKTQPVGGEFASSQSDSFYLHDNLSVTLEMLRNSHQSFIGPKIIVNETSVDYTSASKAILSTIGYRYYIPSVDVDASSDEMIDVKLEMRNLGIAPTYGRYTVRLTLWDDEDSSVWSSELTNIFLDKLLPDSSQEDEVIISREELDDDTLYTLTASIINERGESMVPMALTTEQSPNEYVIAHVRIR